MQTEILQRPANSIAKLTLTPGEHGTTEGGSMVAMSGDMKVETTTHKKGKGSIGKALKRMMTGESLFLNHYECGGGEGMLYLAPALSGDMLHRQLNGETLMVQGSSFLAHTENVDMDMSWQGMKNLFSGESMFWIKLSGQGDILLNAFGAIYPVEVDGEFIVDTGHIVAFTDGLTYNISKVGGSWLGSFLGGEGLVCRFKGQGTVWCQSHNPSAFGFIVGPLLRPVA